MNKYRRRVSLNLVGQRRIGWIRYRLLADLAGCRYVDLIADQANVKHQRIPSDRQAYSPGS
jgi:hypothetical protein